MKAHGTRLGLGAWIVLALLHVTSPTTAFAHGEEPAPSAPSAPSAPRDAGEAWRPATAADPPILPPRSDPPPGSPIATSASDVAPPSARAKIRELEARVAVDEARLKTLETDLGPLRHVKVQGYVQLQYLLQSFNTAASPNLQGGTLPDGIGANSVIAKSDGTTTNTNLFRLRRTRLRTFYTHRLVHGLDAGPLF